MTRESAIEMYDVTRDECITDYVCEGCGNTDAPRMLQITGLNGVLVICYDGCVQGFVGMVSELALPEEEAPER